MQATAIMTGYPVNVSVEDDRPGSRLSILFRFFIAIPVMIVVALFGYAFAITSFIAWFAVLFTGRYPRGLFNFGQNYMRASADLTSYLFLLTGKYPPYTGGSQEAAAYPVQLTIAYPERSSRLLLILRLILVIPHLILLAVVGTVAFILLFISWLVALFTGHVLFRGLYAGLVRYAYRVNAYSYFMTDAYPPFNFS